MFRNETVLGLDERMATYIRYIPICLDELLRAEASRSRKSAVNPYAFVK